MLTSDYYYELPQELIAQTPASKRSDSRLLVYQRDAKRMEECIFSDILDYFRSGDVLVRNTTRVLPARLHGVRQDTGGMMEFLLLRNVDGNNWEALVKPGRRAKAGLVFDVGDELKITIGETTASGGRIVFLQYNGILEEVLERIGEMPLPPYITQRLAEKERYQTVYSKETGSAAAPTAGLHFTDELFAALQKKGVIIADVLLHVGLGTFRPVSAVNVEDHAMHEEYFTVSEDAANTINRARANGGRIIAVGTTSCRTIESVSDENGIVHASSGMTNIFITPGYRFKAVDALITNFHLPESTLLMLVSALCTREEILSVYAHAVQERYRFFSFGDAMLIL